jgi:hypothetical protein
MAALVNREPEQIGLADAEAANDRPAQQFPGRLAVGVPEAQGQFSDPDQGSSSWPVNPAEVAVDFILP